MRIGICASQRGLVTVSAAGYDYIEPAVAGMLQPEKPETEVMPPLLKLFEASLLKPESYNLFLPGDLKVVGPDANITRQEHYLDSAFARMEMLGGKIAVFGSGGARAIPDEWPLSDAHTQMLAFLKSCGDAAHRHGVVVVVEPLNVSECNSVNSVAEAVRLAEEVNHPAIGVLSDLYHIDHDGQSYEETRDAAPWLRHVHVAGRGRRAPIADDYEFLRGYFTVLKEAGYTGRVSIEANWENLEQQALEARLVVQRSWNE
ncbi:MAG: sugar phosphate isomerase/epimerase family protein [Janthinobacterium lividum]